MHMSRNGTYLVEMLYTENLKYRNSTDLADALKDADGGLEVPDMEDGQLQIDVAIMPCAVRQILAARLAMIVLLTGALHGTQCMDQ